MEWGSVAGTVTAFATLMTAFGGLLLAVRVIVPTKKQAEQIHTIVNQQRTDLLRFQKVLINALVDHGIAIPEDQSKLDER